MAELVLHFIGEDGGDVDAAVTELRQYLSGLPGVGSVDVGKEQPRIGATEILGILALVAKAPEFLIQVTQFIHDHRKHIKDVEVEIDGRRVPVDKLTDDQKARLQSLLQ